VLNELIDISVVDFANNCSCFSPIWPENEVKPWVKVKVKWLYNFGSVKQISEVVATRL